MGTHYSSPLAGDGPIVNALLSAMPELLPGYLEMVDDARSDEPETEAVGAYDVLIQLFTFQVLGDALRDPDRKDLDRALGALEDMSKAAVSPVDARVVKYGILENFGTELSDDASTFQRLGPATRQLVRELWPVADFE